MSLGTLIRQVAKRTSRLSQNRICQSCRRSLEKNRRSVSTTSGLLGVYEPDDLKIGPDIPEYEALNVRMRAYDFVSLESYAKYVHNVAGTLGLETEAWPTPTKSTHIETYKPNSSVIQNTYFLQTYERTVQLQDVPSTILPLFLDVIRCHAPQGITITLKEPEIEEEEDRYVPDFEVIDLKSQINAIDKAREERRKK